MVVWFNRFEFDLNRQNKKHVPILTFHKVDTDFEWGVTRITPGQFQRILHFLKNNGYHTISLAQLSDHTFSLPEKPVILTFDDAYDSIYRYAAPLMLEYGFTGTVFVISRFVDCWNHWDVNLGGKKFKHLSWSQLAELKKMGFAIESHGVSHSDMTQVSNNRLYRELSHSKKEIEDHVGQEVQFISFPFGRYNDRVIDTAVQCRYRKGCGYFKKNLNLKKEKFILERKACYLFDSMWNLRAKLEQSPWTFLENIKLRMFSLGSYGTLLLKKGEYH
jgi:peptidoglycan/xylan/chitin deacetylase (PgdA/CDA1 family)